MDVPAQGMRRTRWQFAALVVLASMAMLARAESLDQITVQAQRDREKLKHEVDRFVSSVIVPRSTLGTRCGVGRTRFVLLWRA
jgi:hypothetical protein